MGLNLKEDFSKKEDWENILGIQVTQLSKRKSKTRAWEGVKMQQIMTRLLEMSGDKQRLS